MLFVLFIIVVVVISIRILVLFFCYLFFNSFLPSSPKKALGKACILLVLLAFLSSRVVVLQNGNWRGTRLNQHSA